MEDGINGRGRARAIVNGVPLRMHFHDPAYVWRSVPVIRAGKGEPYFILFMVHFLHPYYKCEFAVLAFQLINSLAFYQV